METIIEAEKLSKHYWRQATPAVNNLNLKLTRGKAFGFLGSNGAGKTTTIKMLAGLVAPTSGAATVLGHPARGLKPEHWQEIGYLSENQRYYEGITGRAMVDFTARLYRGWDRAFEKDLLKKLYLPLDRTVRQYSHGERIKLGLLLAMCHRPRLLILDEPFNGLDPLIKDEFITSLIQITHQSEWTLFMATHDMEEVERLADEVGLLDRGILRMHEPVDELKARFRQVTISGISGSVTLGPEDLSVEREAGRLRFVHSHFTPEVEAELIGQHGAENIVIETLSLREIYVHLARHYREETLAF